MSKTPGGIFEHLQSGEKFRIRAETYNALMDMATDWYSARRSNTPRVPVQPAGREDAVYVLVQNTTGSDVPQFGILGISQPLVLPSNNEFTFRERHAYVGVTPAAGSPFVVTQVPIANNAIGVAVIAGETACKLTVLNASDTRAGPSIDPTQLTTGSLGPARILWKDSGTGSSIWARVLLTGDDDDDAPCCCPSGGGSGSGPPTTKPPTTTTTTGGMIQTMTGGTSLFDGGGSGGPPSIGPPPMIHCPPGQHLTYDENGLISGCATNDGSWLGGRSGGAGRPEPEPTHALGRIQGNRVAFQGGRWFFPSEIVGGATLTTGDVLYYDSSSPSGFSILSLGGAPNGYVLTLAAGVPSWAAGGGGGSSAQLVGTPSDLLAQTTTQTVATYTVGGSNEVVRVSANVVVTATGIGGSVTPDVNFTDTHGTAQTIHLYLGAGTGIINQVGAFPLPSIQVRAKNGTNVTITYTVSGTITYDGGGTPEKVR